MYGYDLLNRALYARFGSAGGSGVTSAYDALGRVTSTTDSNGRVLQYSYDAAGDRTQLTYADGGANALAVQYAYDNLGRVTTITENGSYALAGFAYDGLGRRTAIGRGSGGALAGTGYAYDGLDRLSQLSQTFASSGANLTLGIARSPSDQLASKSISNSAYVHTPAAATPTYSANGLNQYSAVSGTTYSYDGPGNLTSDGARAFTYDLDNHLLTASAPTAVSLAYDPLGRMQTSTAGGATTNFLYDGDALIAEYDNAGNILRRYVPGPGQDEPLVWYEGAGTSGRRWLHADDTGSIIAWSDASGNAQATYGYGPYGEPGAWSGSRYSYTGQLMIPEAHLYNYKARVYDPGIGRFLQTDPVGYSSDMNTYAYAGGDPVGRVDPTGLTDVSEIVVTASHSTDSIGSTLDFFSSSPGFAEGNQANQAAEQIAVVAEAIVTAYVQRTGVGGLGGLGGFGGSGGYNVIGVSGGGGNPPSAQPPPPPPRPQKTQVPTPHQNTVCTNKATNNGLGAGALVSAAGEAPKVVTAGLWAYRAFQAAAAGAEIGGTAGIELGPVDLIPVSVGAVVGVGVYWYVSNHCDQGVN